VDKKGVYTQDSDRVMDRCFPMLLIA